MMQTVGALALGAGIVCLVAAIWIPDHWWQLGATAVLLIVAGAALAGQLCLLRP